MTEVQVLHFDRDGLGGRWYEHVATVDAPVILGDNINHALEYAYRHTQNLGGSWSMEKTLNVRGEFYQNPDFNPRVTVVKPLDGDNVGKWGHRSSMIGDRMIINGQIFKVDSFGFSNVGVNDVV